MDNFPHPGLHSPSLSTCKLSSYFTPFPSFTWCLNSSLASNNLFGDIPATWSALTKLQTVYSFCFFLRYIFLNIYCTKGLWTTIDFLDSFLNPGLPSKILAICMFVWFVVLFWMTLTFPSKGHWIAIISLVHFPHLGLFSQIWILCTSLSSFSKLSYYLQFWISAL